MKERRIIIQRYRFRDSMHRVREVGIQSRRKGIHTYGLPSRVRSYKGRENGLVADNIINEIGPGRGSMITGPSTHKELNVFGEMCSIA